MASDQVDATSEIGALLKRAKEAHRAGDKVTAISCLQKVVARAPQHEAAWVWLGGLLSDPQEAITCLHNALAINPDNKEAQQGLEWWQRQLSAQSPEIQAARECVARAARLGRAGQLVEAVEEYRLAIAQNRDYLDAWMGLGTTCQQLVWEGEAAFAFREVLRLDPKHSGAEQQLRSMQLPRSRAGAVLWSTDVLENEGGNFLVSANGQWIMLTSGGAASAASAQAAGRQSGRIHLIDRRGNAQTISTDWSLWQAGLSEDGKLVYATQAALKSASIMWIEPAHSSTPIMRHVLQNGPPTVWKRSDDLLVVTSGVDGIAAIDFDGNVVWQAPHDPCGSIKFQPCADEKSLLAFTQTLQSFANNITLYFVSTTDGKLAWRKAYQNFVSAHILNDGVRVLVACARLLEAVHQQGGTLWQHTYREITGALLSPSQQIFVAQYQHGNALAAIDVWGGQKLWERPGLLGIKGMGFANLGQTVLVLHSKATLEALDAHKGDTLWQVDLAKHTNETGRALVVLEDWVAVAAGQILIAVDLKGQILGSLRLGTTDVSIQVAPSLAGPGSSEQGRELIITEAGRRMGLVNRTAKMVWEQTIPCKRWLPVPHSPYLVAVGPKGNNKYTLTMIRWT